jgi:actin-related protein
MDVSTVVIDNGAHMMRAGFGGDFEPFLTESVVGHSRPDHRPILEHRQVTNWEDLTKFWENIFDASLQLHLTSTRF